MLKDWGVVFICENCGAILNIPTKALNKSVSCSCCGNKRRFPDEFSYNKIIYVGRATELQVNVTFD
jgi:RNase P subunit RPR2